MKYPGHEVVKLNLRLPKQEHRRLTRAAKGSLRSLNSEIIHRLKESLERKAEPAGEQTA